MKVPNIGPFQRLLCLLGWHRAGQLRWPEDGYERARCRGCGRNLRRKPGGPWKRAELKTVEFKAALLGTDAERRQNRNAQDSG